MASITLLGAGNVGQHLCKALFKAHHDIVQVYNRTPLHTESLQAMLPQTRFVNEIDALTLNTDLYLIAVSDDAIAEVSDALPLNNGIVVHTSGATSLSVLLKHSNRGIFYPLQTFTAGHEVDFTQIPFCIDANFEQSAEKLIDIASTLSPQVYRLNDQQRIALHVSAVFANNFTNHMFAIAEEICQLNQVPFDIIKPLISETLSKIQTQSPRLVQTGPAKRNDFMTIQAHLDLLKSTPLYSHLYVILSESILTMYQPPYP